MASSGVTVTDNDRGPLLNIINWIFLVATFTACLLKIASKRIMVHLLQQDDYYMAVAMLATVGFGVALSFEVSAGLGTTESELNPGPQFDKAAFVAQLFYIISLCLARLAILYFFLSFALRGSRRLAVYGLAVLNVLWFLASIFSIAFQCKLPQSWAITSGKCFNQRDFWLYVGVTDAFIDLVTALLPTYLLHDLHLRLSRKLPVILVFSSRILLIPVVALRVQQIYEASNASGQFVEDFEISLLTIIHVNLNVIFTCIPFMKPVTDNLQSGILASDIYVGTASERSNYPLKLWGRSSQGNTRPKVALFSSRSTPKSRSTGESGNSQEQIIDRQEALSASHVVDQRHARYNEGHF